MNVGLFTQRGNAFHLQSEPYLHFLMLVAPLWRGFLERKPKEGASSRDDQARNSTAKIWLPRSLPPLPRLEKW